MSNIDLVPPTVPLLRQWPLEEKEVVAADTKSISERERERLAMTDHGDDVE